jgi:tetratricopeptide (TPR) repeat protein
MQARRDYDFYLAMCLLVMVFLSTFAIAEVGHNLPETEEATEWHTRLEYARLLSYMKKFEESTSEYQKLLAEKPDAAIAKIELAKIYYYQKKNEEAITLLRQITPEDLTPEAEVIWADILVAQKDYQKAEELYKKNISANPKLEDTILLKIADVQSWQKNYKESLDTFQILLKRHPYDVQLKRKYALVLFWAGKDEEAANLLEETLKNESGDR